MNIDMPSFSDSVFLFLLALLLFGPKKLPVLARELGKWLGEFRRASNEFKYQMEEELRIAEQEERTKKIAEMEAAAPVPPSLEPAPAEVIPEPEHPHLPSATEPAAEAPAATEAAEAAEAAEAPEPAKPLPIATAGEINMMPPATGLPTPRGSSVSSAFDNIPPARDDAPASQTETATHG